VVFNSFTGAVLSARSYSSNGVQNYHYLVKSMVISSGVSPMAYVLTNALIVSTSITCYGQHLFKFDPKTITSHPSAWIKKTIGN
jgi:hypothetical protein